MDYRKEAKASRSKKLHQLTVSSPDGKVDASGFTPYANPEMDKKTGKRPVNPRAFKRGGKVTALEGGKAQKRGDRMGAKGRMAKQAGGNISAEDKAKMAEMAAAAAKEKSAPPRASNVPLPPRRPEPAPQLRAKEDIQSPYKKGGRTKKMIGGDITSGGNPQIPSAKGQTSLLRKAVGLDYEKGGKVKKMNGGPMMAASPAGLMKRKTPMNNPAAKAPAVVPMRAKGGKVSHMEWEHSKKDLAQDKKLAKKHGMSLEKWEESEADKKHDKQQSTKGLMCGGRTKRASGGRAKGKSNINIVIAPQSAAPQGMPQRPMMPPPPPPPMGMPPMGMPPGGMPMGGGMPPMPMGGGMPPMPMGGPAPMPPGVPGLPGMAPLPRKSGGRVKSYKDMTAGAGSGEGRLQKEEMAEYKRVGRKTGGKVQSYEDMTAGAGSGEGRLQKTELQENKRKRVKKQFGGAMGYGTPASQSAYQAQQGGFGAQQGGFGAQPGGFGDQSGGFGVMGYPTPAQGGYDQMAAMNPMSAQSPYYQPTAYAQPAYDMSQVDMFRTMMNSAPRASTPFGVGPNDGGLNSGLPSIAPVQAVRGRTQTPPPRVQQPQPTSGSLGQSVGLGVAGNPLSNPTTQMNLNSAAINALRQQMMGTNPQGIPIPGGPLTNVNDVRYPAMRDLGDDMRYVPGSREEQMSQTPTSPRGGASTVAPRGTGPNDGGPRPNPSTFTVAPRGTGPNDGGPRLQSTAYQDAINKARASRNTPTASQRSISKKKSPYGS